MSGEAFAVLTYYQSEQINPVRCSKRKFMLSKEILNLESLEQVAQVISTLINQPDCDHAKLGELILALHKKKRLALLPMPVKTKKSLKNIRDLNDKLAESAMGPDNTLHEIISDNVKRIEAALNLV